MKRLIPSRFVLVAEVGASYFWRKRADEPSRIKLSGNLKITGVNAEFKTPGRVAEIW